MFEVSPKSVRHDSRLSPLARLIYIDIMAMADYDGKTKKDIDFINACLITIYQDVSDELQELLDYGYLAFSGTNVIIVKDAVFVKREKKQVDTQKKKGKFGGRATKKLDEVTIEEVRESEDAIEVKAFEITKAFFGLFVQNIESSGGTSNLIKGRSRYKTWVNPIYDMLKNEQADVDQFRLVFKFLRDDDFWKKNILSTTTLAKKFDTLIVSAKSHQNKSVPSVMSMVDGNNLADIARRLEGSSVNALSSGY